jgi:hypothetical protein
MTFGQIRTLVDAQAWLQSQPEVRREQAHMLGLMLGQDAVARLLHGAKLTGKPGV